MQAQPAENERSLRHRATGDRWRPEDNAGSFTQAHRISRERKALALSQRQGRGAGSVCLGIRRNRKWAKLLSGAGPGSQKASGTASQRLLE